MGATGIQFNYRSICPTSVMQIMKIAVNSSTGEASKFLIKWKCKHFKFSLKSSEATGGYLHKWLKLPLHISVFVFALNCYREKIFRLFAVFHLWSETYSQQSKINTDSSHMQEQQKNVSWIVCEQSNSYFCSFLNRP